MMLFFTHLIWEEMEVRKEFQIWEISLVDAQFFKRVRYIFKYAYTLNTAGVQLEGPRGLDPCHFQQKNESLFALPFLYQKGPFS